MENNRTEKLMRILLGMETNEVRLGKATAPRLKYRPWRWDVIHYRMTDGKYPGVLDTRVHLRQEAGYCRTRLGALWAIGKHLARIGVTR